MKTKVRAWLGDVVVAVAGAWIVWDAAALYLLVLYRHLFPDAAAALLWYGRSLGLVTLCALPLATAIALITRALLPSQGRSRWSFAAMTVACAAGPALMWAVFGPLALYAFDSAPILAGLAAVALAAAALVPLTAWFYARVFGSRRRLFALAAGSVAAALVAALRLGFPASAAVVPASAPSETAAVEAGAPPFRPNVILLTMDALRADHLSAYGYARPTSPAVDELARRATVFSRCYASRPKTSPSFATLFTGLRPARHGLRLSPAFLDDSFTTLAETLAANGYDTSAVVENRVLAPAFNFAQGFRHYENVTGGSPAATERLVQWLRGEPAEPFFVWRHVLDPHAPYAPPAEHAALFPAGPEASPLVRINERGSAIGGALPLAGNPRGRTVADYVSRYDAEIHSSDEQIRRILAALDDTGLRRRSIIVFTADHGESLGEHNYYFEHGVLAYDGAARVPLLIEVPEAIAGAPLRPRVERVVENVGVYPTLLQLCGIPTERPLDGTSLLPWMLAGGDEGEGVALFEAGDGDHMGPGWLDALVEGRWKYIRRQTHWMLSPASPKDLVFLFNGLVEGGLEADELYDLAADPREEHNLVAREAERARSMRARLEARLAALPPAPANVIESSRPAPALDETTRHALEQLGYGRP